MNKRLKQLAILVVLIFVGIQFVYVPLSDRHKRLIAENQALAHRISKARQLWENREVLEAKLSEVDAQLEDLKKVFPLITPEDAKSFQLKQQQIIEGIVKKTGVKIKTLAWLPITDPFLHQVPVKIVGQGTPQEFFEIIRQLEMRPEFIDIYTFSLRGYGKGPEVTGEFEAVFYALDGGMEGIQ
jgi:hypothetical protein